MLPRLHYRLFDILRSTYKGATVSMTGMDYWKLMGIMLPVFRMCFILEDATVSRSILICVELYSRVGEAEPATMDG